MDSKLALIIHGRFDKQFLLKRYLPTVLATCLALVAVARILFPDDPAFPYRFWTSTISRLGWNHQNINGWLVFNSALVIIGVALLPAAAYFYRAFSPVVGKRWPVVATGWLIISVVGLVGMGLVPNVAALQRVHVFNSGMAFVGLYAALVVYCTLAWCHRQPLVLSTRSLALLTAVIAHGVVALAFTVVLYLSGFGGFYVHDPATPVLLAPPIWEWQVFASLVLVIYIFARVSPEVSS